MGFSVNVDHANNFAAFSKACDSLYSAADKHITQFERASPKTLNYVPISSPQTKGTAESFSKSRAAKLTTIDNVFNALMKNNKDYVNTPEFQAIEKKWQGNTYLREKLEVMKKSESAPIPDFFSDFPPSSLDMGSSIDSDKPIL